VSGPATPVLICEALMVWCAFRRHIRHRRRRRTNRQWLRSLLRYLSERR